NDYLHRLVITDCPYPNVRRVGVLTRVDHELADQRKQEVVIQAGDVGIDRHVRVETDAPSMFLSDGDYRRLKTGMLKDGRVKLEDGVAQLGHGLPDGGLCASEALVI